MSKHGHHQIGQRIISGGLAAAGIMSVTLLALHGQYKAWPQVISGLSAVGGCYLFGYFALRGRLPGKLLSKADVAIKRTTGRHDG